MGAKSNLNYTHTQYNLIECALLLLLLLRQIAAIR